MTAAAAAMLTTCHHASDRLSSSDSELGRAWSSRLEATSELVGAGRRVEEDLRGLLVELVGADPVDVLVEAGVGEDRLRRAGGGRGVQRVGDGAGDQPGEEGHDEPERDRGQDGGRGPAAQGREQDRQREPQRDVDDRHEEEDDEAGEVGAGRDQPEAQDAVAGDRGQDRPDREGDGRDTGDELAVDHVVAVDRLGHEAGERALRALAADGVEAQRDAEQRAEEADELVEGRHPVGREREQVEEQRRRPRGLARGVADVAAGRVDRGQPGERHQRDEDHEADRADVVGQLLGGDDAPARDVALLVRSARVAVPASGSATGVADAVAQARSPSAPVK